jgi:hypothetical protein
VFVRTTDRFFARGLVALALRGTTPVVAGYRLRDIRQESQSILPRGESVITGQPTQGYAFWSLTFEALRSGANVWPRQSPIFTKERPLELVIGGPSLTEGDVLELMLYAEAVG